DGPCRRSHHLGTLDSRKPIQIVDKQSPLKIRKSANALQESRGEHLGGESLLLRGRFVAKGCCRGDSRLLGNNQVLKRDAAPPSVEVNAEVARYPEQPGVQSPLGRIESPTAGVYTTEEDFAGNFLGIHIAANPPATVAVEATAVVLEEGVQ